MLNSPSLYGDPAWCWKVLRSKHTTSADKREARSWLRFFQIRG